MRRKRHSKHYDGTNLTSRPMQSILPGLLSKIGAAYKDRPDLIVAGWEEVVGEKLAPMAVANRFEDGVLFVNVKNSTLYSLLNTREKPRLVKLLRQRFPRTLIKTIIFRLG